MPRARARSKETVAKGRWLRKNQSLPETLLWIELKGRQQGFRFRRQHRIDPYVLDFFCQEVMLDVEVDSAWHDGREQRDQTRDAILQSRGVCILRIHARDIFDNPLSCALWVRNACSEAATWRELGSPPAFKSNQFVKYP